MIDDSPTLMIPEESLLLSEDTLMIPRSSLPFADDELESHDGASSPARPRESHS